MVVKLSLFLVDVSMVISLVWFFKLNLLFSSFDTVNYECAFIKRAVEIV